MHRALLCSFVFALFLAGCGVPKTVRKVKKALTPDDVVERIAAGDVTVIVPIALAVLNASQDFAIVHRDDTCVVAEVRKIPGLGISMPAGKDSRYYLRIDMKSMQEAAGDVKVVLSFFKSAVGAFREVMKPDTLVGKYAQQIIVHTLGAMIKAGVVFK